MGDKQRSAEACVRGGFRDGAYSDLEGLLHLELVLLLTQRVDGDVLGGRHLPG